MYKYDLGGILVFSNVRLRMRTACGMGNEPADIVIIVHDGRIPARIRTSRPAFVSSMKEESGVPRLTQWYKDGSYIQEWGELGTCHISASGRRIEYYHSGLKGWEAAYDCLLGPVLAFALQHLGYIVLHGSAVCWQGGVTCFLGESGDGKTTLALSFVRQGASLVADDLVVIQQSGSSVRVLPILPSMEVWPDSAAHLGLDCNGLPRVLPAADKREFWPDEYGYACSCSAIDLACIYLLERVKALSSDGLGTSILHLSQRESVIALVTHTHCLGYLSADLLARQLGRLSQLVADYPVRRLCYPSSMDALDEVRSAIQSDVTASTTGPRN